MEIFFDIDGVLCDRPKHIENLGKEKYNYCFPIKENIKLINNLYEDGNMITLYTARGMSMYNGDKSKCYRELYFLTYNQMKNFGVKFHKLIMGKPHYDLFIDDKVIAYKNWVDLKTKIYTYIEEKGI